jgi:hypothetical protein
MKVRAQDLIDIVSHIETIKTSKLLSEDQKQTFYREIQGNLPLDMFCHTFKGMRQVLHDVLEKEIKSNVIRFSTATSRKTKKVSSGTAKKSPTKAKDTPRKSPKE